MILIDSNDDLPSLRKQLLEKTALKFIYIYSYINLFLSPLFFSHYLLTHPFASVDPFQPLDKGSWQFYVPLVLAVVSFILSGIYLYRYKHGIATGVWRYFMVTYSPFVFTLININNIHYPNPGFDGLLNTPDMIAIIFLIFLLPLMLASRFVWVGGILYGVSFVGLLIYEYHLYPDLIQYSLHDYSLWACWMLTALAFALIITQLMQSLVKQTAVNVLEHKSAQSKLKYLVEEHHDAHSLLTSARLHLDLMKREHPALLTSDLEQDLNSINEFIQTVKVSAFQEVRKKDVVFIKPFFPVLKRMVQNFKQTHPQLEITLDMPKDNIGVYLSGGVTALRRLITNLVDNACEGDGVQNATHLWVHCKIQGDTNHSLASNQMMMTFQDNGPGYPNSVLNQELSSSKLMGTGSGLMIIQKMMALSDGEVDFSNTSDGARATLLFMSDKDPLY